MDRFDTMLAFTRVLELGSFTQAAVSLNLPKATVSAQVAALEKRLNIKLLHRTTRQVSATTDGTAYYQQAVRLLNELEQTESALRQSKRIYRGRLRVDTSLTVAKQILLPNMHDFLSRYPEIDLELGCTDRTVDLLQEGIDCAIRGGMPIDESLVARKLIETSPITCASPSYFERNGTPQHPQELEQHHVINFISPRTGKIGGFKYIEAGEATSYFGRRKIALNDIDACLSATLAGLGIAQLPYFSVRNDIASGKLVRIFANIPSESMPAYIVYLQNRHLSANVRVFVDWAIELFAQEQERYHNTCCMQQHDKQS
jgi:LysR family transcriptional regulator, regulator for bpeEF and oprC